MSSGLPRWRQSTHALLAAGVLCLLTAAGFTVLANMMVRSQKQQVDEVATQLAELQTERRAETDSIRRDSLRAEVERYQNILASRQYHLAGRTRAREGMWRWNGEGTFLTVIGIILVVSAAIRLRRGSPQNTPNSTA